TALGEVEQQNYNRGKVPPCRKGSRGGCSFCPLAGFGRFRESANRLAKSPFAGACRTRARAARRGGRRRLVEPACGASAVSAIAHHKHGGAARHLERDQGPSRAAEAMTIGRL